MSSLRRLPLVSVVVFLVLSACNEANFTGNNPSPVDTTVNPSTDIICEFSPAEIFVGEKTELSINIQGERPSQIYQTIVTGDSTKTEEITVNEENGIDAVSLKGESAGTIEVALRLDSPETDPVATCTAVVKKKPVLPVKKTLSCKIGPTTIEQGGTANISIKSTGYEGQLFQKIIYNDEVSSLLDVKKDRATTTDGKDNAFIGSIPGKAKVELRYAQDSAKADAICEAQILEPICEDEEESIGAHIAFLIDNSNSNAATDCPDRTQIGTHKNVELFECGTITNRERAVEAAYGLLQSVREKEPENLDSLSELAVVSFPTRENFVDGSKRETKWLAVESTNTETLKSAMQFTKRPYGLTPYGAAFSSASELFGGLENSPRAKVAVLVTDGEPTDKDPQEVKDLAEKLREKGVQLITVFVTGGETRLSRRENHRNMMDVINASSLASNNGTWFADHYADLGTYLDALTGNGSDAAGLVDGVSDDVIEVQDSAGLTAVFQNIIRTRAIRCEDR